MTNSFPSAALDFDKIQRCEDVLGYHFEDPKLLYQSLTHASIAATRLQSNERLEFLGDAILGAIVCDRLYTLNPEDEEGALTQMKSDVVSRTACAQVASQLELQQFVLMSKGLQQSEEIPSSVMAGIFESIIAAIYLDGGFSSAYEFVNRNLQDLIQHAADTEHFRNSKSQLQQYTQKELGKTPSYRVIEETGPDHSKSFLVTAIIGEENFPPAWGSNKKEAEQKAAMNALSTLQGKPLQVPETDEPPSRNSATDGTHSEQP